MAKLIVGENDLATKYPELVKEWNYEKNKGLKNKFGKDISTPDKLTWCSGQKVWWKCDKGHEWQVTVSSRSVSDRSCPYCLGQIAITGENDLATKYPELAKEWNYEKNKGLKDGRGYDISTPDKIMGGSSRNVWWKCKIGHEWNARISHRVSSGVGCPYCSGQIAITGKNDLATKYSELAKEWNYEKNKGLKDGRGYDISTPDKIMSGSGRKVWWKCKIGHEYKATSYHRIRWNSGCPYCAGKKVLQGFNDLATTNFELVKEWNYEKNGNLKPENVTRCSNKKVWWKCEKGHEWQAFITNRSSHNQGCPICSESHLEKITRKYLNQYEIQFNEQVKFDDLRHKQLLSYDFGILNNKCYIFMIECQGQQHYTPINMFGGENAFKKQQYHDRLKYQYCIDNNIKLIEIKYDKTEKEIENIIKNLVI